MTYRDDITNKDVFDQLKTRIQQVELPVEVQLHIEREQTHLPEIHEQTANLDVAIGFLVSIGKEEDAKTNLIKFLVDKLKMDKDTLPDKVCFLFETLSNM